MYYGIFPTENIFPDILYPLICMVPSVLLYYALFNHSVNRIVEHLHSLTSHFQPTQRSIVYVFMMNFPSILIGLTSLLYSRSIAGLEVSWSVDEIYILLVTPYICHLGEHRQTPLRGFFVLRDLLMLIGCYSCMSKFYYDGLISIEYGYILLGAYFLYYLMLLIEGKMEECVLQLCGLKESLGYNSKFLLSQYRNQPNHLLIQQIIELNQLHVQSQLQEIKEIILRIEPDPSHQQVLHNLAQLILPYKIAFQLQEDQQLDQMVAEIDEELSDGQSQQQFSDQQSSEDEEMPNNSFIGLRHMPTITQADYIQQRIEQPYNKLDAIVKWMFYPVYLFSLAEGRPYYIVSYLSFFMLVGVLFLIVNSLTYLTYRSSEIGFAIMTGLTALLLSYPHYRYFIRVSEDSSHDFLNMFVQGAIMKVIIFGIGITLAFYVGGSVREGNVGFLMMMICRVIGYVVFGVLLAMNRFVIQSDSLVVWRKVAIGSQLARMLIQGVYQIV